MTNLDKIQNDFTYHSPNQEQIVRYDSIRYKAKELALTFARLCPDSAELEQALFLLNLATMSANAAIARNE